MSLPPSSLSDRARKLISRKDSPASLASSANDLAGAPPLTSSGSVVSLSSSESSYSSSSTSQQSLMLPPSLSMVEKRKSVYLLPARTAQSETEFKHNMIANELVQTESGFVGDLELLLVEFLEPMRALSFVSESHVPRVTAIVGQLLPLHKVLLFGLDQAMRGYPALSLARPLNSVSGGVFLSLYKDYCSLYAPAVEQLKTMQKKHAKLRKILDDPVRLKRTRNLRLEDFLIKPVQRLCKYPLLVKELLKCSEQADEQEQLQTALKKLSDAVELVNEHKRNLESDNFAAQYTEAITLLRASPPRAEQARSILVLLASQKPTDCATQYALACALALRDDVDGALIHVGLALQCGYANIMEMSRDEALAPVRAHSDWSKLFVQKLEVYGTDESSDAYIDAMRQIAATAGGSQPNKSLGRRALSRLKNIKVFGDDSDDDEESGSYDSDTSESEDEEDEGKSRQRVASPTPKKGTDARTSAASAYRDRQSVSTGGNDLAVALSLELGVDHAAIDKVRNKLEHQLKRKQPAKEKEKRGGILAVLPGLHSSHPEPSRVTPASTAATAPPRPVRGPPPGRVGGPSPARVPAGAQLILPSAQLAQSSLVLNSQAPSAHPPVPQRDDTLTRIAPVQQRDDASPRTAATQPTTTPTQAPTQAPQRAPPSVPVAANPADVSIKRPVPQGSVHIGGGAAGATAAPLSPTRVTADGAQVPEVANVTQGRPVAAMRASYSGASSSTHAASESAPPPVPPRDTAAARQRATTQLPSVADRAKAIAMAQRGRAMPPTPVRNSTQTTLATTPTATTTATTSVETVAPAVVTPSAATATTKSDAVASAVDAAPAAARPPSISAKVSEPSSVHFESSSPPVQLAPDAQLRRTSAPVQEALATSHGELAKSPTRAQLERTKSPVGELAISPPRPERTKSPPPSLERAKSPPSLERAKSPPSLERAKSPPSLERAKSPPSLERAKSPPPSLERAKSPPPSLERTKSPPQLDTERPVSPPARTSMFEVQPMAKNTAKAFAPGKKERSSTLPASALAAMKLAANIKQSTDKQAAVDKQAAADKQPVAAVTDKQPVADKQAVVQKSVSALDMPSTPSPVAPKHVSISDEPLPLPTTPSPAAGSAVRHRAPRRSRTSANDLNVLPVPEEPEPPAIPRMPFELPEGQKPPPPAGAKPSTLDAKYEAREELARANSARANRENKLQMAALREVDQLRRERLGMLADFVKMETSLAGRAKSKDELKAITVLALRIMDTTALVEKLRADLPPHLAALVPPLELEDVASSDEENGDVEPEGSSRRTPGRRRKRRHHKKSADTDNNREDDAPAEKVTPASKSSSSRISRSSKSRAKPVEAESAHVPRSQSKVLSRGSQVVRHAKPARAAAATAASAGAAAGAAATAAATAASSETDSASPVSSARVNTEVADQKDSSATQQAMESVAAVAAAAAVVDDAADEATDAADEAVDEAVGDEADGDEADDGGEQDGGEAAAVAGESELETEATPADNVNDKADDSEDSDDDGDESGEDAPIRLSQRAALLQAGSFRRQTDSPSGSGRSLNSNAS